MTKNELIEVNGGGSLASSLLKFLGSNIYIIYNATKTILSALKK